LDFVGRRNNTGCRFFRAFVCRTPCADGDCGQPDDSARQVSNQSIHTNRLAPSSQSPHLREFHIARLYGIGPSSVSSGSVIGVLANSTEKVRAADYLTNW
jgi:hypothetical protein